MSARDYRLLWLTIFAVAMACAEAALVTHLRTLYYPDRPLEIFPLVLLEPRDFWLEFVREIATLVMIMAVAMLTEQGMRRIFSAFIYVFGVWDLAYYGWLKLIIGWPVSWTEWDVLFLVPWPWLGPWLAPAGISVLVASWGLWVLRRPGEPRFGRLSFPIYVVGAALCFATFLAPGWALMGPDAPGFAEYVPGAFPWQFYVPGVGLLAVGLWLAGWHQVNP